MDSPTWLAWATTAVLALLQSLLLSLHAWEHRRFARIRLRKPAVRMPDWRVEVIAPCKGIDVEFAENLRPLFEQDHPDYGLTFVVESADDPALGAIELLCLDYPHIRSRRLIAGRATDCAQKIHNLQQATTELPLGTNVLAFVDSDARPGRDWLRHLTQRLHRPGTGAATGYRWFVPARWSAPNALLYAINSAATALISSRGHHLIWGGSWAIHRDLFEQLRLRDAWRQKLCEDLVATEIVARAGLKISFEPRCMIASPFDVGWRGMFSFLRRQYLLGRYYAPRTWMLGLLGLSIATIGFWGGVALAGYGAISGANWTLPTVGIIGALYALQLAFGWLRRDLARGYLPNQQASIRKAAWFDMLAGPIVSLVNWAAMFSSLRGGCVAWRGIRYRVTIAGRVTSAHHLIFADRNQQEPQPVMADIRTRAVNRLATTRSR